MYEKPDPDYYVVSILNNIEGCIYYPDKGAEAFRYLVTHHDAVLRHPDVLASALPWIKVFAVKYPKQFVQLCEKISPIVEESICYLYDQRNTIVPIIASYFSNINDLARAFSASEMQSLPIFVSTLMMKGPLAVSEFSNLIQAASEILYNVSLSIPDVLLSYAAQHMQTWFDEDPSSSSPGPSVPRPAGSSSSDQNPVSEFVDIDLNSLVGGAP